MQTLKLEKPLVFYDLETTGVDPLKDKIVEISALKIDVDGSKQQVTKRMNPEIQISPSAQETHGISNEDVAGEPIFKSFAKGIKKFMEGCDLAGFNSDHFDNQILMREFEECGIPFPDPDMKSLDIMKLERKLTSSALGATYKRYTGEELDGAHGAEADTAATALIFEHQLQKLTNEGVEINSIDDVIQVYQEGKRPVDMLGKVYEKDGEWYWSFGKNRDKALRDNIGYVKWALSADFPQNVKDVLNQYLDKNNL